MNIKEERIDKAVGFYIDGYSYLDSWKMSGCGRNAFRLRLLEMGIMRSNKVNSRKFTVNHDYFEVIDTEEKAYWLGFIYADGYLTVNKEYNTKYIGISLSSKDRSHLEKFNAAIGSSYEIKDYVGTTYNKDTKYCRILISSEKMFQDLNSKGVCLNKSLILKFPSVEVVSKELLRHFIRGYFDGDGSFSKLYRTKSLQRYRLSFEGTKEFLLQLSEDLDMKVEFCKLTKRHDDDKNTYSLKYYKISEIIKFGDFIYDEANVFLDRKRDIYLYTKSH